MATNLKIYFLAKKNQMVPAPIIFQNPIVARLYTIGIVPPDELLDELLALPRESFIQDLEQIIEYELDHLPKTFQEDYVVLLHALLWLGHLKAEESLSLILKIWRLDSEQLDLIFGEMLHEDLWQVPFWCGFKQLDVLKNFVTDERVSYEFARTEILEVISAVGTFMPEKKAEVFQILTELVYHFEQMPDEQFNDNHYTVCGSLAYAIADHKISDLLPKLQELFAKGRIDEFYVGDWEEYNRHFFDLNPPERTPFNHIREWYATDGQQWQDIFDGKHTSTFPPFDSISNPNKQQRIKEIEITRRNTIDKKIGRNDPCPCGSGKKYKKCHGAF